MSYLLESWSEIAIFDGGIRLGKTGSGKGRRILGGILRERSGRVSGVRPVSGDAGHSVG